MNRKLNEYRSLQSWLKGHGCRDFFVSGDNLMTNCPFHDDNKPSFGVIVDEYGNGCYNCFGCDIKGSIADLICKLERTNKRCWDIRRQIARGK